MFLNWPQQYVCLHMFTYQSQQGFTNILCLPTHYTVGPVVNQRIDWIIVDIVSRKPQNKSWLWRYLTFYWVNNPRITVYLAIHIDKEITPTRLTSRNKDDKVWFCLFYLLVIRNWALHKSLIIGSHKHQCKGGDTTLTFSWHDKALVFSGFT